MLEEMREIFESLSDDDKWDVVSGLAWKHAATLAQHRRKLKWEDMKFDPSDDEVNNQWAGNIALMMQWVMGDDETPNASA